MFTASSASRTCGARPSASLYTATDAMPISRQARITRSAISPRLATRILVNIAPLEGDVAVFLRRIAIALRAERVERVDQTGSRVARIDDVVEVAATGRDVRMGEHAAILLDLRIRRRGGIAAV